MEMEEPVSLSEEELSLDEAPPLLLTTQSDEPGPEVLIMTVEIGDGRQDTITVREKDDPRALAAEFAAKHGLDAGLQASLEQLIRANRELVDKRTGSVSPDLANWKDWLRPLSSATGSNTQDQYTFNEGTFDSRHTPKINVMSRQMMEKRSRLGPVHNRLYQLGKAKKSTALTLSTSEKHLRSQSSSNFNYGEWLYVRGKKMEETRTRKIEAKKKESEAHHEKEMTFAPAINKYSALLSPRLDIKTEDLLAKKAHEKKQNIEKMRSDLTKKELKECSFKPQINTLSAQIELSKCAEAPRYEDLYEQARKREAKQKAMEAERDREYSFTPTIELTCGKSTSENQREHVNRMMNSKKKFEDKMIRIRQELEIRDSVDDSGQRLFTPSTGRASSARNSIGVSVFEHLYSMKDHKRQLTERLSEKQIKELNESTLKLNDNTNVIFDGFRRKQYERLFRQLDVNGDGCISSADLDTTCTDSDVIRILNPLLVELQVSSLQLDLNQFIEKVDKLAATLTVQDRAILLKRDSKLEYEENEFRPSISQKTEYYAAKKRASLPASIYERNIASKNLTTERAKLEAKAKELEAEKLCTFKPATTPYLSRKQRLASAK